MRAKNVKDEPGQSIIASIVKDALKRPQKGHKRHKIHKVGKVLGESLWAKFKAYIKSNVKI